MRALKWSGLKKIDLLINSPRGERLGIAVGLQFVAGGPPNKYLFSHESSSVQHLYFLASSYKKLCTHTDVCSMY